MKKILLFSLILTLCIGNAYPLELSQNDRILFIGNSLTHAGSYHSIIRSYLATRYHKNIIVFNKGVSGDVAGGMIERLENDIFVERPTIALVMSGMNDVCREIYCENPTAKQKKIQVSAIESYKQRMGKLVDKLLERSLKVVLLTPTIFEENPLLEIENHIGVNDALRKCAEFVKEMGRKKQLEVVDLHTILNKLNRLEQEKNPAFTIVGKDRVHPGDLGHLVMAYQIIRTLFSQDSIVSDIVINSNQKEIIKASNTKVQNLKCKKKLIEFDVLDNSLPMALSEYDSKAQEMFPVCADFNKELLAVKQLKVGKYHLYIDDQLIGVFSHDQLVKGIRLDRFEQTPQYKQAKQIAGMSKEIKEMENIMRDFKFVDYKLLHQDLEGKSAEERMDICQKKLDEFQNDSVPCNPYFVQTMTTYLTHIKSLTDYRRKIGRLESRINEISQPLTRHYRIIKVK